MITSQEANKAVALMATMAFFPRDIDQCELIAACLESFVAGPSELRWLVMTAVKTMSQWNGIADLRALYASRFPLMDGLPVTREVAGFAAVDAEADFTRRETEETDRKLAEWKREFAKLPLEEQEANQDILIKATELAAQKRLK